MNRGRNTVGEWPAGPTSWVHQQEVSRCLLCHTCRSQAWVGGGFFLKRSEWPQALTHRQETWPAVTTGTSGPAAFSVGLTHFLSMCKLAGPSVMALKQPPTLG